MAYRGRLIFPLVADIYRLDLTAINTATSFDTTYREIKKTPTSDGLGTSSRLEMAVVQIPIQFEPSSLRKLHMLASGDASTGRVVGVMHFANLEALSLVDGTTGLCKIKKGDRLGALRQLDGTLIETIASPTGAFIIEAMPIMGLAGMRNLLQVTFESRDPGK